MEGQGDKNVPVSHPDTEHFWEKPENIMHLIDLIFLLEDDKEKIPS